MDDSARPATAALFNNILSFKEQAVLYLLYAEIRFDLIEHCFKGHARAGKSKISSYFGVMTGSSPPWLPEGGPAFLPHHDC